MVADLRGNAGTENDAGPRDLGWRACLMLLAFTCVMFLPGFFTLPPIDRDEARFAQATRQMVTSGDFVDIRFQDTTRYKKPIGIYWLQSASVGALRHALGDSVVGSIWAYRLPSLAAAMASVVLTAAIGAALLGRDVGIAGGLLLAASMLLNVEARLATTDATLLAAVLTAQFALARAYFPSPGASPASGLPLGTALAGWTAVAVGILVKRPIILLVLLGTIVGLRLQGMSLQPLRALRPWLGLPLTALVVTPWMMLIAARTGGEFFQDSLGHDLIGKLLDAETAGRLPPGMHAVMLWIGLWPGSILLILALPWIWLNRARAGIGFCVAWAMPTWIAFELPATKLVHYVLPAYPALALLAAAWVKAGAQQAWPALIHRLAWAAWCALSSGLCAAVIALPLLVDGHLLAVPAMLAVAAVLPLAYAARYLTHDSGRAQFAIILAAPLIGAAVWSTLPRLERAFVSREIAAALPGLAPCSHPDIVSSGYEEPSLVFLTTRAIRFLPGQAAADMLAVSVCPLAIVERREEMNFLRRASELGETPTKVAAITGINNANSKAVSLGIYVRRRP